MHFSNCVSVLLCFVVKQLLNNWIGAIAGLGGGMAGLPTPLPLDPPLPIYHIIQ